MPNRRAAQNLTRNLLDLRDRRGWTQRDLSEKAGFPRPTIASLESGSSNPTLSVLVRLSTALDVSLDELTGEPRVSAQLYRAADLPTRLHKNVEVRQLLPHPIPGVAMERMCFGPNAKRAGVPHTPGTREYLTAEVGRICLTAGGHTYTLEPGDVLAFRGDQRHSYRALDEGCIAYSVVMSLRTFGE